MTYNYDIRWKQRFNNFSKAYNLLKSVFEEKKIEDLSLLEREGVVQRFEYTYELAWKTLKDYLECQKAKVEFIHARYGFGVIKDDVPFINSLDELLTKINQLL